MKINLFFFILLFCLTVLPARKSYSQYDELDLTRECRKGNGRCKVECQENEIRIAFCIKFATHCCLER
ncbi:beta-defensin 110 [Erinaceus europaeus]|uniref:Beta-defensin n=1 Tax=Erinaceus europaeus TaxID=9365 RepID=A0A1S3APF0_ERIEU|nr:beta-defensin 110 [Erinaceus europaeus]